MYVYLNCSKKLIFIATEMFICIIRTQTASIWKLSDLLCMIEKLLLLLIPAHLADRLF